MSDPVFAPPPIFGYGANRMQTPGSAARGRKLLLDNLTPMQREQYRALGAFEVVGSVTGGRYRIVEGTANNIHALDSHGLIKAVLCFAPIGDLATGDVMLTQKIALETDELAALAVANVKPFSSCGCDECRRLRPVDSPWSLSIPFPA